MPSEASGKGSAAEGFAGVWRRECLGVRSTAVSLSSCVMECYRNFFLWILPDVAFCEQEQAAFHNDSA